MQLYKENGYIEPERLPQGTSTEEPQPQQEQQAEEIATPQQEQQPETAQLPELGGIGKFFEENIAIPLIDQLDGSRDADQVASDRADARQGRADLDQQIQDNPTVLGETGVAVIGGVGDTIETVGNTVGLAGDAIGGVADAVGIIDRDSSDIPWDESYEWADFDLGTAENQTIVGNVGRSIVSTLVGMKGLKAAGVGVGAGKSVASRLASETLRGALYDFFSSADGGNISNLVQLGPLANPFSKALAHDDDDNVWIRRIKNTIEGGTIGIAVDGLQELYMALRAGRAVTVGGGTPEQGVAKVTEYFEQKSLDLGYTPPTPERVVKAYDVGPEVLDGDLSNVSKLDAVELKKLDTEYEINSFTDNLDDVLRNADPDAAMEAFGRNITVKELPNGTKIDWIQEDISMEYGAVTDPLSGQKVVRIDWESNGGELGTSGTKLYSQFGDVAKEQKPGTIIQAEAAEDGYGAKGVSDVQARKSGDSGEPTSSRMDPELAAEINRLAKDNYDRTYGKGEWAALDREGRSIHLDNLRLEDPEFSRAWDAGMQSTLGDKTPNIREKLYMRAGLAAPDGEDKMYGIVAYRPDGRKMMRPLDFTKPIQDQIDAAKELPVQPSLPLGNTSATAGPVPLNRRTSPGKIENDAASGRPGAPEEGGKPALLDPQERVFQGLKEQDTNTAAKSFWDDAEPGGGNSIVDEVDVESLQGLQGLKDFVSTRIPDIDVEDIARRLRRQPAEYVEDVFRSLATFADTKNFADLETLRFVNTFDIKGVDAGGAVVLDTLNKSLADRVSILAGQVADLTELDAPFRVQANQILDRANSMVLLRKEATQFASQNLQNWKDVPNDLKSAVEADRSQINAIFDELRQGLASDDALDIKLAKERFAKLGIALASSKGDPTAQMGVWEALAKVGWNQFEGVYINSMLSSPLTHARNIAGNAIAAGERTASRTLGNLFTGNIAEAKRGLAAYDSIGASLRESLAVARDSLSSPYSRVTSAAKISDRAAASRRELLAVVNGAQSQSEKIAAQTALRTFDVFNSSWFRWPGKALQAGDDFFKSFLARTELRYQAAVEADELAKTASLNPTKAKALRDSTYTRLVSQKLSPTGEILDHKLISISEEATFQRDLEGWAAGMSTGLRSFPGGRIMVPFLRTGHNINRYAKELTPLQMLSKEYGQVMKHGTPDEKAIMNGRIALGSTVMGTTAFMAGADLVTGVGPLPGPQRDLWLKDHEPMSVKVGDKWVSYQALPGFSLLMSTVSDVTQMVQKMSDGNIDYVLGAAPFFFTNAISTQPMFQGVLDMAEVLDFTNNYTPEKVQDTINGIANRMAGNEGLRRHMENTISQNMYDYKNWAVATIGKLTGGILPSAYDTLLGEDVAKVPRIDVLTGKEMVSKYSNPLNSLNPFTVIGKDVSPLVEAFASLAFPINLVVPEKVAGVKLTPDQKNFLAKEIYRDGEMARKFSTTFKSKAFWARVDKWQEDKKLGTARPKEQTEWYRILARIQQKYKARAVKELRNGSSEYSEQFRNEYAAKNMEENSNGLSKEDMNRLRDIQELAGF